MPAPSSSNLFTGILHQHNPSKNPHTSEVEPQTLQWALDYNLIPNTPPAHHHFYSLQSVHLTSYFYPHCNQNEFRVGSDMVLFLFAFDDIADTSYSPNSDSYKRLVSLESRFLHILNGGTCGPSDEGLVRAFSDLVRRIQQTHNEDSAWWCRMKESLREYILGVRWERKNRRNGGKVSLVTFLKMRQMSGATMVCLDWMAMCVKGLTLQEYERGGMARVLESAVNFVGWINDLVGVEKDLKEDIHQNLVVVMMGEFGWEIEKAKRETMSWCEREIRDLLELGELIKDTVNEDESKRLRQFLRHLNDFVLGHLQWYEMTNRYSWGGDDNVL